MKRLTTFEANPHYWPDDRDDDAVERAEAEANSYFRSATRTYKAEYDQTMGYISAWKDSPRWERERAAAKAKYRAAVQPYVDLMPLVIADMLADGQMSEATQLAWDAVGFAKLRAAVDRAVDLGVTLAPIEYGPVIPLATTSANGGTAA